MPCSHLRLGTRAHPARSRNFLGRFAQQLEVLAHELSLRHVQASALPTTGPGTSHSSGAADLAHALTRLVRLGFVQSMPRSRSTADLRCTFWGSVLPAMLEREQADNVASSTYAAIWRLVQEEMTTSDRTAVSKSLVGFFEVLWSLRGSSTNPQEDGPDALVTTSERLRRGTEGTAFLGKGRKQQALSAALALQIWCGRLSRNALPASSAAMSGSAATAAEQAEDEALDLLDNFEAYIKDLILPRSTMRSSISVPSYGPSLALTFAIWLQLSTAGLPPRNGSKTRWS